MTRGPLAAAAGVGAALFLPLLLGVVALGGASAQGVGGGGPSVEDSALLARASALDIPPRYLNLYVAAAGRYGIDWTILAAIGRVECDHGRDPDPSCLHNGSVNSAGAGGPMQFLASTWAVYGVDVDGGGSPDRWDPADAIYGAARYLCASGAPGDYRAAIFAYNKATWYVEMVLHWAARYRAIAGEAGRSTAATPPSTVATPVTYEGEAPPRIPIAGETAELAPSNGHVALIPTGVPPVVQAMIIAGNELEDLPYGTAGHPDPRGAPNEDCSSTVNYVLYRSGVRAIAEIVRDNPLAQDYVHWGAPGPGRWVTIYATDAPTPHVFIVIAGLRLDTSHNGTDVGPNRNEDGPRWRLLDHIPTWAHWSVRHPPGL